MFKAGNCGPFLLLIRTAINWKLGRQYSEKLSPLSVWQDNNKDGCRDGGDEEESPEEPLVHNLGEHAPLPPDLVVLVLLILLLQGALCCFPLQKEND